MSGGLGRSSETLGTAPGVIAGRPRPGVVIAVFGPTGVGKTAVGIELARRLAACYDASRTRSGGQRTGGRVISCDSMQIYRGFRVLTNQPSPDEAQAVEHALVGFADPLAEYSVVEYAERARALISEDLASAGWALLVGGTGLYMRAALAPLAIHAGDDRTLRTRLEARARTEGPAALHAELARLDPAAARAIDVRNVRRVARALEAIGASGRPWSGRSDLWTPSYYYASLVIGLNLQREELYRRINERAALMVDDGGVEEVRRLREERGSDRVAPGRGGVCTAIGYREVFRFLDGEQSYDDTVRGISAATRRYARRQLTWLRKLGDAVIIETHERNPEDVAEQIVALLLSGEYTRGPQIP